MASSFPPVDAFWRNAFEALADYSEEELEQLFGPGLLRWVRGYVKARVELWRVEQDSTAGPATRCEASP